MKGQQFYLKTLITILVFSLCISYFILVPTTFLLTNDDNFSSISLNQQRHNAEFMTYNDGSSHESLFKKHGSNKYPKSQLNQFRKIVDAHKLRRKLFSTKLTKKYVGSTTYFKGEGDHGHISKFNFSNLSEEEKKKLKNDFVNNLKLTRRAIEELEFRTKKQYHVKEWHTERKKRLTASSFGKACRMRSDEVRQKYVNFLLYGYFSNANTRYGVEHEFIAKMALQKVLGQEIKNSGLIVDYDLPFLAASPDGLVAKHGIIEIKCPPSAKNVTPEVGIATRKIKYCRLRRNGKLHLHRHTNYYYQIQGQLHISSKLYCIFCLWTPKGLIYEKINRDDSFWKNNMENQLKSFYYDSLLPEIISSTVK